MSTPKAIDHSNLFTDIEQIFDKNLPQLELYFELGELLDSQTTSGSVTAAAKYLADQYPNMGGCSPRSLRRMRTFYRTYKNQPDTLRKAMHLGWTQNIVIFEADLANTEREWYILAACKCGWSKLELTRKIAEKTHLNQEPKESEISDNSATDENTTVPQPAKESSCATPDPDYRMPHILGGFYLPPFGTPSDPLIRRLDLQPLPLPEIKDGIASMPIIRPMTVMSDTERIDKLCWRRNAPVFLTKDGYAHLVIMSMETYEQQMEALNTYRRMFAREKRSGRCRSIPDESGFFRRMWNAYE